MEKCHAQNILHNGL
jgi:serine/threonine protein kinase